MKKTLIVSLVLLIVGVALGGYLVGQWKDKGRDEAISAAVDAEKAACASVEADLGKTQLALEMAAYQIRLGRISIDAARLNYGTAKDEAIAFFTDLTAFAENAKGSEYEAAVSAILENRDQVVADLSVGSPTAAESLQNLYLALAK